ncbi:MAG: methyltransferase domain-containing protein [Alphaproteobacteria bacterium]|nr:methyltransferase domain-containing protein [Alphaproteobacteria bacterium]
MANSDFNDGAAYERLMGRWSRLVGEKFLDWLAPQPNLAWADIGCGNGAFTEEIIRRCQPASVLGLDPAEGQIAFARMRPGTELARFETGDAQALPFPTASLDMAVMALVIAFIPDPAKALAEQVRVVKPGGTVATYMWDMPGGGFPGIHLFQAMQQLALPNPRPPSSALSTREALESIWTSAGLKDVASTKLSITVFFENFDDYWTTFTLPAGPQAKHIMALTDDKKAEMKDILRRILPIAADGRIAFTSFANAVKGRRP